ncbi:MAG: hypothetical protein BKP49_00125 [Treponema sp. CETP13]|nr:MAG: hypothetical protein BKP49_00125 [Treponema sp. CETP13]
MGQANFHWEKLDNTAHLFPAISTYKTTNVFRQSVILKENIEPLFLQLALEEVIKLFPAFRVRLRSGFFWYYLEQNMQRLPLIQEENEYPCTKIPQLSDNGYLFKVSFWKKRINVEIFHALTDGTGAQNFLQELVLHYLAIAHIEIEKYKDGYLSDNTSLNREDSFFNNYRRPPLTEKQNLQEKNISEEKKAVVYHSTGEKLTYPQFSVIHGFFSLNDLKQIAKKNNATINEYLTALFSWCFYKEQVSNGDFSKEIAIAVPVNLRPWFKSITTKNFFVMTFARFLPTKPDHTFTEVLKSVQQSLAQEITKENFKSTLSNHVANEKSLIKALVPLRLKNAGIKYVYKKATKNSTSTASNFGSLQIPEKYRKYISAFHGILPNCKDQPIRVVFSSYQDIFCVTFSSVLENTYIQQKFFSFLSKEGLKITLETNGEYNGNM